MEEGDINTNGVNKCKKVYSGLLDQFEVAELYSEWADRYEEDLSTDQYSGPCIVADYCSRLFDIQKRSHVTIMDIAAGTGLLGQELFKRGFGHIHALDPSDGMLKKAKNKHVYSKFFQEFITSENLPIADSTYDCVTSSGGYGQGHIPVDSLTEITRIVKPGGYFVNIMREEYVHCLEYKDKLEPFMEKLEQHQKWKQLERLIIPSYAFGKTGVLYIFQVLR